MRCLGVAGAGAVAMAVALAGCGSLGQGPAGVSSSSGPASQAGALSTLRAPPQACDRLLAVWLHGMAGAAVLRAVHRDLAAEARSLAMINHDVVASDASVPADAAGWRQELAEFQRDLVRLDGNPAPSCGAGIPLRRAVAGWLRAVGDYVSAAQDLAGPPTMSDASAAAPDVIAGNAALAQADANATRAAGESRGLFLNVPAGTGAP